MHILSNALEEMQVTTNEQINPLILGRNGPIRLRTVENGRPNVITHLSDLEGLFPGNELLSDKV